MLNLNPLSIFRSTPAPVAKKSPKRVNGNYARRAQLARKPSEAELLPRDSSWLSTMQNASVWAFYNKAQMISLAECGYRQPYQTRSQRAKSVERANLIAVAWMLDQMSAEQYVKWYTRRIKLSVIARDAMSSADVIRDIVQHEGAL